VNFNILMFSSNKLLHEAPQDVDVAIPYLFYWHFLLAYLKAMTKGTSCLQTILEKSVEKIITYTNFVIVIVISKFTCPVLQRGIKHSASAKVFKRNC
jgi:hypothetical protein